MNFNGLLRKYGNAEEIPDDVFRIFADDTSVERHKLSPEQIATSPFGKEIIARIASGKLPLQMELKRSYAEQTGVLATKTMVLRPLRSYESRISGITIDFVDDYSVDHGETLLSRFPMVGERFDLTLRRRSLLEDAD